MYDKTITEFGFMKCKIIKVLLKSYQPRPWLGYSLSRILSFSINLQVTIDFYKFVLIIICKHLEIYTKTITRLRLV